MSEKYIVSARKYRPSTFRSVVGQQSLTHTLKTAIASGRSDRGVLCSPLLQSIPLHLCSDHGRL